MKNPGEQLAKAAGRLVGVPFRLHGRDPSVGLDCIGLVAASFSAIGRPVAAPSGYRLRNTQIGQWLTYAKAAGLVEAGGPIAPGDVLLVEPGPGQHHLMIAEHSGCAIHAHASLRRVVRQPFGTGLEPHTRWRLAD